METGAASGKGKAGGPGGAAKRESTWRRRTPEDAARRSPNVTRVLEEIAAYWRADAAGGSGEAGDKGKVGGAGGAGGPLAIYLLEFRPTHKHLRTVLANIRFCRPDLPCVLVHPADASIPPEEAPAHWIRVTPRLSVREYSELLEEAEFYEASPFDHMLIMQTDSALALAPRVPVECFMRYDYAGAMNSSRRAGNGGFSLRRCAALAAYCRAFTWHTNPHPEDWFFSSSHLLARAPGDPRLRMPPPETLRDFSYERFGPDPADPDHVPIGLHKLWLFRPEAWRALAAADPGFALAASIAK
jgi:hypothetical protein